jgi:pilus assembly protein CpaB
MQMSVSRKNVLTLAVLLGALTTFLIYLFLTRQGSKPFASGDDGVAAATAYVVVPKESIRPMQLLRADQFRLKKVPRSEMPRDAVTVPADLTDKVSIVALSAGDPVQREMVATRGPELGLPYAVRPPRRAMTIGLDPVIGVAGFLKPGNRVDVLATFETDRGVGMVTRTILQDLEILAIGSEFRPTGKEGPDGKEGEARPQPTATLAVLPAEAEKLALAEIRGKLRLVLRSVEDDTYRSRTGVSEVQVTGVRPETNGPTTTPSATPTATAAAPAPYRSPATTAGTVTTSSPTLVMPTTTVPVGTGSISHEREIEVIRGTQKEIVTVKDGKGR